MEEHDDGFAEAEARIEAARRHSATGLTLAGLGLRELPPALGRLHRLESLSLRGNRLTELPAWLSGLSGLAVLDLADNPLVELPPELGGLTRLVELDLTGTRHLIAPPPEVVAQGTEAVLGFLRAFEGGTEAWTRAGAAMPEPESPSPVPPGSAEDEGAVRRLPPAAFRIGAVAAAVALVGTAAALIGSGSPGGKETAGVAAAAHTEPDPSTSDPAPSSSAGTTAAAPVAPASSSSASSSSSPVSSTPTPVPTTPPRTVVVATDTQVVPPRTTTTTMTPQYPVAPPNVDLARGRPVSVTSSKQQYVAGNAVDGDSSSYWESTNGSNIFPQTLTVDLGTVTTVGRLEFDLPPVADWNQRTETITVRGAGADGVFTTVLGPHGYSFDARTGDSTGVSFTAVHIRYLRLVFTANTGWPAAQLSGLGVFS